MLIEVKITADSSEELLNELKAFVAQNEGSGNEKRTRRTKAELEAAKAAEAATKGEAAELRRTVGTTATVVEGAAEQSTDEDPLGEAEDDTLSTAVTIDDVRTLLVEVKNAYPRKPTLISDIVKTHGGAAKLADVDPSKLAAIAAEARKQLAAAGK